MDTIAAIATPPGRGAIGIIRLSGPLVSRVAEELLGHVPAPRSAELANFRAADGTALDQGLALYFPAPASYTGEDMLELHGHGGPVVLDTLMRRALQLGCRSARPGEFSERAYLNGKLDEDKEIYIQEPPGYESLGEFVKLLLKAIYGLKQAVVKWYHILCRTLTDLGFCISAADPGVFYTWIGKNILVLAVHVDDCRMTGDSPKLIVLYKHKLNDRHALTELRPVNWLLGIKVTCDQKAQTISLSQTAFIESIIAWFSLTDAKVHATPMIPAVTYSKEDSPKNQANAA